MTVSRRSDHSPLLFLRRTISAQIHAAALAFMIAGMVMLLPKAWPRGLDHFFACLVFVVGGAMVFLTSAVYHFLHDGYQISKKLELFLEDVDHYCIYIFIAATYTPLLINAAEPPTRHYLLIAVWAIALFGIVYTRFKQHLFESLQSRAVYTGLFVLMGVLLLGPVGEITPRLSTLQFSLLLGGCASYLLGAIGYATRRPVLLKGLFGYHELWHVMVFLGAFLHFICIYLFYLKPTGF